MLTGWRRDNAYLCTRELIPEFLPGKIVIQKKGKA
jgi:hypothetical protein